MRYLTGLVKVLLILLVIPAIGAKTAPFLKTKSPSLNSFEFKLVINVIYID